MVHVHYCPPRPDQEADRQGFQPRKIMRPLGFDVEDVLDTALELFWELGSQTPMREIETATGISQSSIYNTFGSKEGLLEAALDHYEAHLDREVLSFFTDEREGLKSIDNFLTALHQWVKQPRTRGCLLLNVAAEEGGTNIAIKKRARAFRRVLRAALQNALARAADRGEMEAAGSDWRADLLLTLILGFNITARAGASDNELARQLHAVRDQIRDWREAAAA